MLVSKSRYVELEQKLAQVEAEKNRYKSENDDLIAELSHAKEASAIQEEASFDKQIWPNLQKVSRRGVEKNSFSKLGQICSTCSNFFLYILML